MEKHVSYEARLDREASSCFLSGDKKGNGSYQVKELRRSRVNL